MDLTQIALPWSQEVLLANETFIKKQPAVARNFMKGFVEGLSLWHTNKPLTMELLAKFVKIDRNTNLKALEEAYTFMRAGTEKKPYPNAEGLQDCKGGSIGRSNDSRRTRQERLHRRPLQT